MCVIAKMEFQGGNSNWITTSNALARSAQNLTLGEKRLISMAISKLDSRAKVPKTGECPIVKITAKEFADVMNLSPRTSYTQLHSAADGLMSKRVTFFEAAHRRGRKKLATTQISMQWVGEARYVKSEAYVEIHFWHRLVPHLMGLQKQFTTYQLQQATALRSIYSWRLLELLTRFRKSGIAEYTVEDFAAAMGATEKQRANFNNIKRRMIEPAVKEMSEKDGWSIEWEPIKRGRRVHSVKFTFERKSQMDLFPPNRPELKPTDTIQTNLEDS